MAAAVLPSYLLFWNARVSDEARWPTPQLLTQKSKHQTAAAALQTGSDINWNEVTEGYT